jgi:hypothetical protein
MSSVPWEMQCVSKWTCINYAGRHDVYLNCYWKLFPTSAVQPALSARVLHSARHICIYIIVCIELHASNRKSERLICKFDVFYNNFNYAATDMWVEILLVGSLLITFCS